MTRFVVLGLLLIGLAGGYVYAFLQVGADYLPVWTDEGVYCQNARAAYETHTLQAAFTFNGTGNSWLGTDAHGPAFYLVHGGLAKLTGWSPQNLILLNVLLLIGGISMVMAWPERKLEVKMMGMILLMCWPYGLLFSLTFMQEMVHFPIAVLAGLLLFQLYVQKRSSGYVTGYVVLLVLAGLFRPLWLFWLIGLLPYAYERGKLYLGVLGWIAGVVLAYLLVHFLDESVPNYFSQQMGRLSRGEFDLFIKAGVWHVLINLKAFLVEQPSLLYAIFRFAPVVVLGVVFYLGVKTRNGLWLSLSAIGALNVAMLFLLYDAFDWREVRTMMPFYIACMLPLFFHAPRAWRLRWIGIHVLALCLAIPLGKEWVEQHRIGSAATLEEER
ncbi:MAG: hypothetical protein AAGI38_21765, partial [Bacteroidota bacterium]